MNFERAFVVLGGLFTFFMLIGQFVLEPCIQDQLIFRIASKLDQGQKFGLHEPRFYKRK